MAAKGNCASRSEHEHSDDRRDPGPSPELPLALDAGGDDASPVAATVTGGEGVPKLVGNAPSSSRWVPEHEFEYTSPSTALRALPSSSSRANTTNGPGPLISTRVPVKTTSANSYASVSVKAAQSQAAARCGVPRVNAPDVTTAHSSAMFTTAAIRDLTTPSRTTRTNYKFPGATNENPPVGCEARPLAVRCRSPVGRGGQFAARRSLWPVLRAIDRLGAQPPWCRTCSTPLVPPMSRRAGGTLR